ncbi:hypothetical protein ACFYYP_35180 [Microbispora rosea]|uniref:hypothetical protein n=1 Tax=Microbispora rosea TaxID=58117 RepID=UPI0036920061
MTVQGADVGLVEGEGDGDGENDGLGDGDGDGDRLGEADGDAVGDTVGEGVGDGEGEAVPPLLAAIRAECARNTASAASPLFTLCWSPPAFLSGYHQKAEPSPSLASKSA